MRQLFVTTLMLGFGAMFTWLTATALEQYALSRHQTARADGATPIVAVQKTPGEHWMF